MRNRGRKKRGERGERSEGNSRSKRVKEWGEQGGRDKNRGIRNGERESTCRE